MIFGVIFLGEWRQNNNKKALPCVSLSRLGGTGRRESFSSDMDDASLLIPQKISGFYSPSLRLSLLIM